MLSNSDTAYCAEILRRGSKSFALAGRVLPARLRGAVTAVYAFCRQADDAVDLAADVQVGLHGQQQRLAAIYRDTSFDNPVDRALAQVVRHNAIPQPLFAALLEGFAWDAAGRRYQTIDDLYAYAARVAGSVGVIMTLLMGQRCAAVLARAGDLGVAMQLTNIARDVGEDARAGRLYLPTAWMHEAGVSAEEFIAHPTASPPLAKVIQRLLEQADVLYRRAEFGIAHLPKDCRIAIYAARLIYASIGQRIAAARYDSVSQRAVVSRWRKLWLLCCSSRVWLWRRHAINLPSLEQNIFLLNAANPV